MRKRSGVIDVEAQRCLRINGRGWQKQKNFEILFFNLFSTPYRFRACLEPPPKKTLGASRTGLDRMRSSFTQLDASGRTCHQPDLPVSYPNSSIGMKIKSRLREGCRVRATSQGGVQRVMKKKSPMRSLRMSE